MEIHITPAMTYVFMVLSILYIYSCIWWAGYATVMDSHIHNGHRPASWGAIKHSSLVFLLNLFLMPIAITLCVVRFEKLHMTEEHKHADKRTRT